MTRPPGPVPGSPRPVDRPPRPWSRPPWESCPPVPGPRRAAAIPSFTWRDPHRSPCCWGFQGPRETVACRVPLGCLDYLDLLAHGDLGVPLGLMATQACPVLLEPKDRKGTQGSHQERPSMGQRATWACLDSPAIRDLWDERATRAILDRPGTPENRGRQDLRAAQGPKVTLAGRGYLGL